MKYRVLGPLAAGDAEITAGRDRVVLAMLLLQPDRFVAVDTLVDAVWDTDPPVTARTQLQTCVSRLRRVLGADTITTRPGGYGIALAPDDLDLAVFDRLVAQARGAAGPEQARRHLRQALDLWRGPALPGVDSAAVRAAADVLDGRYAAAAEDWAELALGGGPEDLPAELTRLVARFPLRERLRGQLMLALCRAGRQADALAEYRRARAVLADELGIEPGRQLRDLHRRILAGDIAATAPPPPAESRVRCLPRPVGDFTGRTGVLTGLRAALDRDTSGPAVRVIDGMAGVGKTTLAVRIADLVEDRYPDAHLFIDLHGHSDGERVDPAAALAVLLRQLGVAPERIPAGTDERTALWRSELAGRRVVLLLDNAASSAQVRPLLPGAGTSLTLVTSRHRLSGLDGVRPESLGVLSPAEAADLFTRIVGDRALAEPEAVAEVVRRCGRLPLAVRLAAARLANRRRWQVSDLLRRLAEAALPELAAEDRTVAAAFALSYRHLPDGPQRLFRLLGVHPGERFEATVAAAIADLPLDDAEDLLDTLADAYLVEEPEPGGYRLHDLMREYAATLAAADPDATRLAAQRLFDHTVDSAYALAEPLEAPASRRALRFARPVARPDLLPAAAIGTRQWMDRDGRNHMAILRLAESSGAHESVWQLARSAWRLWYLAAEYDDLIEAHRRGLAAARALGDESATATMANYLASGLYRVGQVRAAADMLTAAYTGFREQNDEAAATIVLSNVAALRMALGDVDAAEAAARESLERASGTSAPDLMATGLNSLGTIEGRRGNLRRSLDLHRQEMLLGVRMKADSVRYLALNNVAIVRMRLGHGPAERLLRLSISLNSRIGGRSSLAESTSALGLLLQRQGRFAEAISQHRAALDIADQQPDRRLKAHVRVEHGDTLLAAGDRDGAAALFQEAVELAGSVQARLEQAHGMAGLAAALAGRDPVAARRYADRAEAMSREMNIPIRIDRPEHRLPG